MKEIKVTFDECSSAFRDTEEYRILENYRTRLNRLTFDERLAITKGVDKSFGPLFEIMKHDAPTLTDSDLLFCALSTQGFETVAIAECMTVTKEAVRSRKFRLREKLPQKWLQLLFPNNNVSPGKIKTQNVMPGEPHAINDEMFHFDETGNNETLQKADESDDQITLPAESVECNSNMNKKMTFAKAVATCFCKYFTTRGRARRSEYWNFFLFYFTIVSTIRIMQGLLDTFIIPSLDPTRQKTYCIILISLRCIIELVLMIPSFTVTVRRLHDRGLSGGIGLVIYLFPWFIVFVISNLVEQVQVSVVDIILVGTINDFIILGFIIFEYIIDTVFFIVRIIMLCKPGTEGPNQYGPDPTHYIPEDENNL